MEQRIRRIAPGQTAKVLGILYVILGALFMPFFLIAAALSPGETGFGIGFALAMPIVYGVFGAIMVAIFCALYNLVAGWVGGIEVELIDSVQET